MNKETESEREPVMGPDDPTVEADQEDPNAPGPGDSDAGAPPTGDEPSDDEVVRPD